MAIDVGQDYGSGHTSVYKGSAVVTELPFTFAMFFKSQQFDITKTLIEVAQFLGNPADRFSLRLSGGASTGTVLATVSDFVLVETSETTDTFSFGTWNSAIAVFEGSGTTATSITAYLNGVAATPNTNGLGLSPDGLQRTRIFGGPDDPSSFGFNGCAARGVISPTAWSLSQCEQFAAGVSPSQFATLTTYFKWDDVSGVATDEVDTGWLTEEFGDGFATCADGPSFLSSGSSSYVRIMG